MAVSDKGRRAFRSDTFTVCLAEILKVNVDDIPASTCGPEHPEIGYWLAARNLALVPVHNPSNFQWAAWWIGRLANANGYVVMAGTPSGVAWIPEGVCGGGDVVEGWVAAPPALSLAPRLRTTGTVEGIYRYPDTSAAGDALQIARLIAGVGLAGDRYALGKGHFQSPKRWGQALPLIEAEAIEELKAEHGVCIAPIDARRNVLTHGIDLNGLIGERFRIGRIHCQGSRLAEPCSWLQRTTPAGTLRGLVHRGGLRADILENGTVTLGDRIELVID